MEKSFDKYYVKRDPSSGRIMIENDKPVLGECVKRDCRLIQRRADLLNRGWRGSGIYYQELIEKKEPVIKKAELVAKCTELGIDATGTMAELTERINNHNEE